MRMLKLLQFYASIVWVYIYTHTCICACQVTSMCLTLCDPMDHSLPGVSVHRFLQARILAWVAMPSFRGSSQAKDQTWVSYIFCISRQVLCHSCLGSQMCVCVCVCVCICIWYIYIYIYIYIYLRVRETDNILEGVGHWFNRATFVWYLDQFFSFLLKIISTE